MKTRHDFVSNSSSSSFIVLGSRFSVPKLRKMLGIAQSEDGEDPDCEVTDAAYDLFDKAGLEYLHDYADEAIYAGLPPSKMKSDETLDQFRQRVAGRLQKALNAGVSPKSVKWWRGVQHESGDVSWD